MKVILVIDKPESCTGCPLSFFNRKWFCLKTNKDINITDRYHIPEWCPLKPVPELKTPEGSDVFNDYVRGYNEAVEKIIK